MTSPRVLVVDDEADLRELLEITLVRMGLDVDSAETLREARAFLTQNDYGLILTDMRLPDGLGLELVQEVNASNKSTPIAVVTAYGSAENAVVALKAGAFDYVSKPVVLDDLRVMVQSALRLSAPATQSGSPAAAGTASRLIGESAVMQSLRNQIDRLARSMAPIAITGESGSGKELVAREIHARSSRAGKPFIAVNCGAIPEALMEAEFFGYRKGAFTGAADERDGFFHAANGGTLMLDEVADLPLAMQVKLLRAIQERRVRKIGATSEEPVDVRIISATHQNLAQCVETGKFRQDLFYRLNVIELSVPPLRERLDDLGVLVAGMLARLAGAGQQAALGPQVLETLSTYSFPGNVRELENVLERALAFANDGVIEVGDLSLKGARVAERPAPVAEAVVAPAAMVPQAAAAPASVSGPAELPSNLPDYLEQVEREIILRALTQTQFNRTQAALLLGISFRQLRYQMQKLNIQEPEG
ncbi:sigma-54-dependent transcriptional regulator [Massilia antarctica]|uniref:sigma-54-dependent transcriptional regulator n=1 Tax=Massilia antarctica TaxID=2765360 RepID=UPI0006BB5FC7|nr:sigma-54 dependent transcriptional regulator [Massilia sp. H27-R4]MCY0913540.1 sigma-54 dependent transcriptional regulator [Massilia sp. H27-R4]CUI09684.1 Type IV fimbriae expression regulatory protein PilR [Janthinobacterium sp. CG23_2]CUU33470.1 Type IV fimbriae expression regulatory protein PilR [Janthinobacterium sp. CG23_2]